MATLARDIMTADPACCSPETTLDRVANMMLKHNCGEIPIVSNGRVVGVVTDRDIVCRVVARGMNPGTQTAESCMTRRVVTVSEDTSLDEIISTMEQHQVRRLPVVKDGGWCTGIVSQADVARTGPERKVAELLCEVSQDVRH